jgi:GT2 family glycosyltransferase
MTPPSAELTTLIVSYNTRALLAPCLGALETAQGQRGKGPVIVVDNASRDGSADEIAAHFPQVHLIRSAQNIGFGRANNLALGLVHTPFLLLLNTDAFVPPEALARTLAFMDAEPGCGILGVKLVGRDGSLQPSCRTFPTPLNTFLARTGLTRLWPGVPLVDDPHWNPSLTQDCDWVPGCFYLIRREVLAQVGLFDPRYFLYFEEVDHCRAAKQAGWRVCYCPDTQVVHLGGESAASDSALTAGGRQVEILQMESALLYFRKHQGISGLACHVALEILGDFMLAAKALLKGRGLGSAAFFVRHSVATLQLCLRTTWGRCSSR